MSRSDITALSEGTDRKITISKTLREFLMRSGSPAAEAALGDFADTGKATVKAKP